MKTPQPMQDSVSTGFETLLARGIRFKVGEPTEWVNQMTVVASGALLAYDRMMRRACEAVFWSGIAGEIKLQADSYETCQAMKPANQKETLVHHTQKVENRGRKRALT